MVEDKLKQKSLWLWNEYHLNILPHQLVALGAGAGGGALTGAVGLVTVAEVAFLIFDSTSG